MQKSLEIFWEKHNLSTSLWNVAHAKNKFFNLFKDLILGIGNGGQNRAFYCILVHYLNSAYHYLATFIDVTHITMVAFVFFRLCFLYSSDA